MEKRRILAVDDNSISLATIEQELKREYEVIPVNSGERALQYLRRERPDLILMDIQMPIMNGYEATKAIRAMHRKDAKVLPIIAMTANAMEEDKEAAFKSGMNAHIAKPLNIELLMDALRQFLH